MKLLFFLYSLSSGGAERVTVTLANHWAEKGWDIVVVTVAGYDLDFYALDSRIRRVALDMASESRHPVQALAKNLRRMLALRRVLQQERPQLAVAMMTTANAILAVAGQLAGVPVIGSERIHPPTFPLGWAWEFIRKKTYPLLSGLVAQTGESADWLRNHAQAPHIVVIPNPVNYPLVARPPQIEPSEITGNIQGQYLLLAVGRLEDQKGFDRLIAAFAKQAPHHSNWTLVILGEGRFRDTLIQQTADLGIMNRVLLPGVVGNVGDWYAAAEIYVLVSRFEGFPNTLLEAMAYGVPSVAVDCETGPREILRHDVDGLLVPQDDPEALATALDRMMGDAVLRERLGRAAVEVRERFSCRQILMQWEKLIEEVVNDRREH